MTLPQARDNGGNTTEKGYHEFSFADDDPLQETKFNFIYIFPSCSPRVFHITFLPVFVGKPIVIPRDKSYFTPCFVDNTPFSPRLLLFHLIIRLCCTREIEGGGVKTRIILLKFCLRLSPFAILNRSDLHIRGKKFLRRSSR